MPSSLGLAVFDCDGTLVDSQRSIVRAMSAAFGEKGLPAPDPARVRRVVGLPLAEAIGRLWPEAGAAAWEDLADTYKRHFTAFRLADGVEEPMFPYVTETLYRLADEGWLLGVATGKSRRGLLNTLRRHGLLDLFTTLQAADSGPGKPAPDMLLRAIADTGASPGRTVMVGDTTYDIHMARAAEVAALGVAWGYHETQELIDAGAYRVIDDGRDLRDALHSAWEIDP